MAKAFCWTLVVLGIGAGWAKAQQASLGLETIPAELRASFGSPAAAPDLFPPNLLPPPATGNAPDGLLPRRVPNIPPGYSPVDSQPPYNGSHSTLPRPVTGTIDNPATPSCGAFGNAPGENDRPCGPTGLLDNFSLFFGLDGSKEPIDLGINASFGYRVAFNWGIPLVEDAGLGLQVGTALNYSHNAQRVLRFIDGTTDRSQNFTTLGLFQRTPCGLSYGFVYDFRFDEYFNDIDTSQWRYQVGVQVGRDHELGFWGAQRQRTDQGTIAGEFFHLRPINQWNLYWRRVWTNEIATRFWVGIAEEHGRFDILLPGQPHVRHPVCFGGDFYVPLNPNLAIYGEASFITPNDTGTVTATLGLAWYPGTARNTARSRFAPLFPLANNPTFALDLQQQ